ncbi:MAG: acyltransferase family protein [Oscillospiraceae bacterium]|nr:acyltransferase family protein [Oscillospiraceae bacterium]
MSDKRIKRRIEIIDIAKCIAIFMVILGHTSPNSELAGNPPMLTKILYSIHMPLFFFLSGLSMSPKPLKTREERRLFFRKMVLTVVIPYFLWALIYSNFNFPNVGWILYGSRVSLGKAGSVTSLWFLSCLFCARIFVQGIFTLFSHTKYGSQRPVYVIPAVVCLIIGALLPHREIGYPWCLDIAFVASACILLGVAFRDGVIKLSVQKAWVLFSFLIASVFLYGFLVHRLGDNFVIMMMCENTYGDPVFAIPLAVLGGFAVLLVSMLLKRMVDEWLYDANLKPMVYLGQHTMGVFLLHKPMLQEIFVPAFRKLLSTGPDILVRLLATVVSLVLSILLCILIEYYIPELVGIFSKDIIAGKEKA